MSHVTDNFSQSFKNGFSFYGHLVSGYFSVTAAYIFFIWEHDLVVDKCGYYRKHIRSF